MKLILGNLTDLKVFLLNESLRSQTTWNANLQALGNGIAGRMEGFCNRSFARTVGDIYECPADRYHVVLPRFPVEAAPTVKQRDDLATGFVSLVYNDLVIDHNLPAGLIKFTLMPGVDGSRLQFTYTGGYWVPDDEADETDAQLPAGASLVPAALKFAWLLQCQHAWKLIDKLGTSVGESGGGAGQLLGLSLGGMSLVPEVEHALRPFVRQSLT